MGRVESEEIPKILPQLDAETEFAYFRPELANQGSLFQDGRLKNYVPKYSTLEYFLTGLFVKNLLWVETTNEKQTAVSENNG